MYVCMYVCLYMYMHTCCVIFDLRSCLSALCCDPTPAFILRKYLLNMERTRKLTAKYLR